MKTNKQSIIVQGTIFEGKVSGTEDLRVEGEFKGDVTIDGVFSVSPEGKAEGQVKSESAVIEGKFNGGVKAGGQIRVAPTGEVRADVVAPSISIEKGAKFSGKMDVSSSDSPASPSTAPAATAPAKDLGAKPADGGNKGGGQLFGSSNK